MRSQVVSGRFVFVLVSIVVAFVVTPGAVSSMLDPGDLSASRTRGPGMDGGEGPVPQHSGHVFSAFSTVAPTLDGAIGGAEWADADCVGELVLTADGVSYSNVTVCVKNDLTSLYMLVTISNQDFSDPAEPCYDFTNIIFDNDHDGTTEKGDNRWAVRFDGFKVDVFNPNGIPHHSQDDVSDGGTDDLAAGISHTNPLPNGLGDYTIEYGAPLASGDAAHDFTLGAGSVVGFGVFHSDGDPGGTPCGANQSFAWPATTASGWADIVIAAGPATVEHFKCYDAAMKKGTRFVSRVVRLEDQFEKTTAKVVGPDRLCNPAQKNQEPLRDRFTHLVCYRLHDLSGTTFVPINVTVRNQFGEQKWTVVNRDGLCVPSEKNREGRMNPGVDHFKCYKATRQEGTPPTKIGFVTLADQFEKVIVRVLNPDALCNPVSKDNRPIQDPKVHLACYQIWERRFPQLFSPFPRDVYVENQFQKGNLTVLRPRSLCVPSEKGIPPPPPGFNHFKCYFAQTANGTGPFDPRFVVLADQFGNWRSNATEPARLCNPVSKDGGPVPDPRTHLACYFLPEVQPDFAPRNVQVGNQFGNQTWTVLRPDFLCNPAEKNAEAPIDAGFNHFLCYQAQIANGTAPFQERNVTLVDQFGNVSGVAVTPRLLCNPVSKDNSPIRDLGYHLACYAVQLRSPFDPRDVRIRDQFGLQTWSVLAPTELCLPSTKTVLGPP